MTFEFTPTGLTIQTYQEIFDELVAGYQAIYGPDINVAVDSPDGQRIGIEAKARLDLQTFALSLYNQLDPDFSSGEFQNKIIKLSGITRGTASRSQVDMTITTDRVLTLNEDYAVEDDLGQSWVTIDDVALVSGANTVTMHAEDFGVVDADANTITTLATFVNGVLSATNPLAAVPGRNEETNEKLRIRRNRSLAAPATSTTGGLFAALGNLTGVTDLEVYENDTKIDDPVLTLDANSLWCVVEGGAVADIIETIAKNKTGGTGLKGTVTGTYIEELFKPDGTPYFLIHEMAFDRPTEVPMFITMTVEAAAGVFVDTDAIKAALAARGYSISEIAMASNLYKTVYTVADNFTATLLEISDDDITYTDGALESGADEVFTIAITDITITDITPP